jgi:transcriptional regulator GlxA family with amidase domain
MYGADRPSAVEAHSMAGPTKRRVLILAFDGVTLVDVVGPADVFDLATRYVLEPGCAGYEILLGSVLGGDIKASNGIFVRTQRLDEIEGPFDTLIVPGGGPPRTPPVPPDTVAWLANNAASARRLCAVCTGTFLLGAAGLISDRRVTTHWESASVLQEAYPLAIVDAAPIYVRDGSVWTSAGFSAGSDVAVALIEDDFGHHIAIEVARKLIVFLKRTSDLPQISTPLVFQSGSDEMFSRLHAWISANLNSDLSISSLSNFVGMTPRTFARAYAERLGRTPAKTVETLRLEAAFRLLVNSTLPLKRIAFETGFGNEQNLRRTFLRSYDLSPLDIRHSHGGASSPTVVASTQAASGSFIPPFQG